MNVTGLPETMQPCTFDGKTKPTKASDRVIRCESAVISSAPRCSSGTGRPRM